MSLAEVLTPPTTDHATEHALELSADLAMRWACTPALWRDLVTPVAAGRSFAPLFEDDRANGWVIAWASGSRLALHDHGGASGTVAVVQGSLVERFATARRRRARRTTSTLTTRSLRAGSVTSFRPDHVHEVWNAGVAPAISIHVYAPGLRAMSFLDATDAAPDRLVRARRTSRPAPRDERPARDELAELAANLGTGFGGFA